MNSEWKEKVDLFRNHRTGWRRDPVFRRTRRRMGVIVRRCSISEETAAAKGTAGWPAQGSGKENAPSS